MASTQPAGGSAEGPKPPEGNKLKRLLLRYDPPALGAEFTDPTGQLVVRRVALPDLREQHIDLGDLASQIVEIEPDIHIRHKPMVFKILLRLEQELKKNLAKNVFGYLARCEEKIRTTTLKNSKNHAKIVQNAGQMPSKFENRALKTLFEI